MTGFFPNSQIATFVDAEILANFKPTHSITNQTNATSFHKKQGRLIFYFAANVEEFQSQKLDLCSFIPLRVCIVRQGPT